MLILVVVRSFTCKKKRNHGMVLKAKRSRLKTAFVLTGGGSKGALQAGMLKVLFNKIRPDVMIGTSIGAFNAGLACLLMLLH